VLLTQANKLNEKLKDKLNIDESLCVIGNFRAVNILNDNNIYTRYSKYINKYASEKIDVLFVGMNPTQHGMAQTGVPFGDPIYVNRLLKLGEIVPAPFLGFKFRSYERSGRRFWRLIHYNFADVRDFFNKQFIINYCPLLIGVSDNGDLKGVPLEKAHSEIKQSVMKQIMKLCNKHLKSVITELGVKHVVALGDFVDERLKEITLPDEVASHKLPHPGARIEKKGDQKKWFTDENWAQCAVKILEREHVWCVR
jgi:uracil-DNA glycosylase